MFKLVLAMGLISMTGVSHASNKVVLSVDNHVVMQGDVTAKLMNDTISKIASHPKKSLYLYINSPGGSIHAGRTMINFLKNTDKKIYCVVDYAASMAFSILQYCHKRIVSNNSILMQHEASLELSGSIPNFISILKMYIDMIRSVEGDVAKKLKLSYSKYKSKVTKDWWLYGKRAVDNGVADEMVQVSCTNNLIQQTTGAAGVVMFGMPLPARNGPKVSKCPINAELSNGVGHRKNKLNTTLIKRINRLTHNGIQD